MSWKHNHCWASCISHEQLVWTAGQICNSSFLCFCTFWRKGCSPWCVASCDELCYSYLVDAFWCPSTTSDFHQGIKPTWSPVHWCFLQKRWSHLLCRSLLSYRALGEITMSSIWNGWGFVCHIYHHTVFAAGSVPPRVLRAFCERRAFIYFLEIVAQLIAMAVLRNHFPALIIALIDNQAGLSGLLKGYGKDSCINNLLAFIWRLICHFGWNIHLNGFLLPWIWAILYLVSIFLIWQLWSHKSSF